MPTLKHLTHRILLRYILFALALFILVQIGWLLPGSQSAAREHLIQHRIELHLKLNTFVQTQQSIARFLTALWRDQKHAAILPASQLTTIGIDALLIINTQGQIVTERSQDTKALDFLIALKPSHTQLQNRQGWYLQHGKIYLVSTYVLDPRHSLWLMTSISSTQLTFAAADHLDLHLTTPPEGLNTPHQAVTSDLNDRPQASPRLLLVNLAGQPSVMMTFDTIYAYWMMLFLGEFVLFVCLLLLTLWAAYSFNKIILKPTLTTHQQVGREDHQGEPLTIDIPPSNIDELQRLTEKYNTLVSGIRHKTQRLAELADRDGLTGLYNRRAFDRHLAQSWHRASRIQSGLAIIICDVDFFKYYNDSLGHQAGDDVLKQIAQLLQSHFIRATDFVARYGGEEFVIVAEAQMLAPLENYLKALQNQLRQLTIEHPNSKCSKYLTLSIGACVIETSGTWIRGDRMERFIQQADQNLYQAKAQGRNLIVCTFFNSLDEDRQTHAH